MEVQLLCCDDEDDEDGDDGEGVRGELRQGGVLSVCVCVHMGVYVYREVVRCV